MSRLCTECGKEIGNKFDVTLQKKDRTGDLCEECWDREWGKLKKQIRSLKGGGNDVR